MKNYTSETPASTSMNKIEKALVKAGARDIMKSFNADGTCNTIAFILVLNAEVLKFQLPARLEAIYKKLYSGYTKPTERSKQICKAQAERTAWKIIADWVEIQITLIELDQAEALQLFLPYMTDGKESFYDKWKANNYLQLLAQP